MFYTMYLDGEYQLLLSGTSAMSVKCSSSLERARFATCDSGHLPMSFAHGKSAGSDGDSSW